MRPTDLVILITCGFMCSCAIPWSRALDEPEVTVFPTEDGATYINVSSQRSTSADSLRRRWKSAAKTACAGDYIVLSEDGSARKVDGRVRGRTYEGYVQCVDPEASQRA